MMSGQKLCLWGLKSFPVAQITNDHKLSGLKQHTFIFLTLLEIRSLKQALQG